MVGSLILALKTQRLHRVLEDTLWTLRSRLGAYTVGNNVEGQSRHGLVGVPLDLAPSGGASRAGPKLVLQLPLVSSLLVGLGSGFWLVRCFDILFPQWLNSPSV